MAGQALSSEELAREIARLAGDKKAADIVVLDVRSVVSYTDFFVICTGNTERQTRSIQEGVNQGLKHADAGGERLLPTRVEGHEEARWILMDYLDCVVHIFTPEARDFYRLETLWGEVPKLELEQQLA
jgi:ribosome-associated protein